MHKEKQLNIRKETQFISLLTLVMSQIKQGSNLYIAFQESSTYCDDELLRNIQVLIESLEVDQTLQPYLDFAGYFKQPLITQICILLYQYGRSGHHDQIMLRFLPLLEQLKQANLEAKIKYDDQQMNAYLVIPIVSVLILTIYFAIGLLSLLVVTVNG